MKQMITQFLRWLAGSLNVSLGAGIAHTYLVVCFGPDGRLKWADTIHNLVTTEGLNKYLDACLKTGLASPAWYVSLVKAKTTGYAAGDTLASHGGWTEGAPGTDWTGNRIGFTPGTIATGSVDNSGSKAVFPILGTLTISGALLCSAATGTSGTLLGVGDFTGGSKGVGAGDTLSVTVTASLTAS
jgi:hypothetical protein